MSNALLSSLPRFDKDDQHPAEQLRRMLGQMKAAAARPTLAAPVEEIVEEDVASPEVDLGPSLAEVDGLIGQLSSALTRIESESRNQAMQVTQSLAARLFPELSRKFLAEEIGQHLTRLVLLPGTQPGIALIQFRNSLRLPTRPTSINHRQIRLQTQRLRFLLLHQLEIPTTPGQEPSVRHKHIPNQIL